MKAQNKINWPAVISDWEQSGLTKSEFCRNRGVTEASFYSHLKKIKGSNNTSSSEVIKEESFIELSAGIRSPRKQEQLAKVVVINTSYGCRIEIPL